MEFSSFRKLWFAGRGGGPSVLDIWTWCFEVPLRALSWWFYIYYTPLFWISIITFSSECPCTKLLSRIYKVPPHGHHQHDSYTKIPTPQPASPNSALHPKTTSMPSLAQTLPIMATIGFKFANAAMGPAFSTGPVSSDTFIREATSTLVLPKVLSGSSGDASLWVGMGTSNGELVQSIADNWQSDDWNVYAYTLLSTGG